MPEPTLAPVLRRSLVLGSAVALAALLATVLVACSSSSSNGPTGVGPDRDFDGVPDASDNCPDAVNERQFDSDGDGLGNVCDNCPALANPDQTDLDQDGVGDACEGGDLDGDGWDDAVDNCPATFNPGQADNDGDGIGDDCDSDDDNDGIPDGLDGDRDGDGVANGTDWAPDDRFRCRDLDGDFCDDCSSGTADPFNDGPDSDGDGYCDAGIRSARAILRVTASRAAFGVDVSIIYDRNRVTLATSGAVSGVGPYDEASYFPTPPDILVSYDTPANNRVNAVAAFATFSPDPSYVTPADVLAFDFTYGPITPTLGDFGVLSCEVVDINSDPILGATCAFSDVELNP